MTLYANPLNVLLVHNSQARASKKEALSQNAADSKTTSSANGESPSDNADKGQEPEAAEDPEVYMYIIKILKILFGHPAYAHFCTKSVGFL